MPFQAQILTLTISSFDPESDSTASSTTGDYSAVFPLLVIAVFVSLMASRDTIVYGAQRSRGDITAVPEVLCRPGMDGSPLVVDYDRFINQSSSEDSDHPSVGFGQEETAEQFAGEADKNVASIFQPPVAVTVLDSGKALSSERLDEILGILQSQDTVSPTHQRTHSAPSNGQGDPLKLPTILSKQSTIDQTVEPRSRSNSAGSQKGLLVRVSSFGDIQDLQPSLMEQARHRAASSAVANPKHRRIPSLPTDPKANTRKGRHGRASSLTSDITTSLREPLHIPISRGHVPAK
jgi:hypothetical protein